MCTKEKDYTGQSAEQSAQEEYTESSPKGGCCGGKAQMETLLGECTKQLLQEQKSVQDWQQKYISLMADFDNFKRRTSKEAQAIRQQVESDMLADILSIVDDFDRALDSFKEGSADKMPQDMQGFVMIHKSLEKLLSNYGVTQMNNYTHFNPEFHEALAQVENNEDQYKPGQIVAVLQKGYLFGGQVLRHAKVSVAE
jgi:molecular chaperone GrpE